MVDNGPGSETNVSYAWSNFLSPGGSQIKLMYWCYCGWGGGWDAVPLGQLNIQQLQWHHRARLHPPVPWWLLPLPSVGSWVPLHPVARWTTKAYRLNHACVFGGEYHSTFWNLVIPTPTTKTLSLPLPRPVERSRVHPRRTLWHRCLPAISRDCSQFRTQLHLWAPPTCLAALYHVIVRWF